MKTTKAAMTGRSALTAVLAMAVSLTACRGTISSADSATARWRPAITIAEDGRPTATIVVSADADDVVKAAVTDLQLYIEKMSGAKLPIAHSPDGTGNLILVGRSPAVDRLIPDLDSYDLGADGVVIRSFARRLVITGKADGYKHRWAGRTDCGTPNAVYHFLDSLGCRWYMPGDDGEVVPRRPTITVPGMDVVSKPAFDARHVGNGAARAMGGKVAEDSRLWLIRNRAGQNTYHQGHSMKHLLPRRMAASHPEYFALVDGERRGTDGGANICTTNPEVIDTIYNNLNNILTQQRPWRSYPVGHYDAWLWCECEPCRAEYGDKTFTYETKSEARSIGVAPGDKVYGNVANSSLLLVNKVAERIEQVHPDCLITFYALYNIPGFPDMKPRDNVMPVMCHIVPTNKDWRAQVLKWEKISRQLFYYGYMGHRTAYPKLTFGDDIRWCHEHKGTGLYFEANEHSPINTLPCYLASRVLWDAGTDSQQVLAKFYRDYYGAAAGPVREFWEAFDAATRAEVLDYDCHYGYPASVTPQVLRRCRRALIRAASLAAEPVVHRRVQSLSRYWTVVEAQVKAEGAFAKWTKAKTPELQAAAEKAVKQTIEAINATSDAFNLGVRMGKFKRWLTELQTAQKPKKEMYGGEDPLLPGV